MRISGLIDLPGDKSISHRSLMLGALAQGVSIIHNISTGEDVESTKKCLKKCGIKIENNLNTIEITGGSFKNPTSPLDCGNSGTTVRLLCGLLAGQGVSAEFIGDNSLSKRPMNRVIQPLKKMGIDIKSNKGYLPFKIYPKEIKGISYSPKIASAQVKSSIILAALGASGITTVNESIKTRDHSEIFLKSLGANISMDDSIIIKPLIKPLNNFNLHVPGDPSSAAFFAAATALIPNSSITIKNILANPTRIGFFKVLEMMNGGVEWQNIRKENGETIGDVHVFWKPLNGIDITKSMIPGVIDELPIIAILASQADGPTRVNNAEELRVKESDRIKAICFNLSRMGGDIIEKNDGFIINQSNNLHSTEIVTFGDHRIAMSFTIAGLLTKKRNILDDSSCINISFPKFNQILDKILV